MVRINYTCVYTWLASSSLNHGENCRGLVGLTVMAAAGLVSPVGILSELNKHAYRPVPRWYPACSTSLCSRFRATVAIQHVRVKKMEDDYRLSSSAQIKQILLACRHVDQVGTYVRVWVCLTFPYVCIDMLAYRPVPLGLLRILTFVFWNIFFLPISFYFGNIITYTYNFDA
jgi:hypothetical protein